MVAVVLVTAAVGVGVAVVSSSDGREEVRPLGPAGDPLPGEMAAGFALRHETVGQWRLLVPASWPRRGIEADCSRVASAVVFGPAGTVGNVGIDADCDLRSGEDVRGVVVLSFRGGLPSALTPTDGVTAAVSRGDSSSSIVWALGEGQPEEVVATALLLVRSGGLDADAVIEPTDPEAGPPPGPGAGGFVPGLPSGFTTLSSLPVPMPSGEQGQRFTLAEMAGGPDRARLVDVCVGIDDRAAGRACAAATASRPTPTEPVDGRLGRYEVSCPSPTTCLATGRHIVVHVMEGNITVEEFEAILRGTPGSSQGH